MEKRTKRYEIRRRFQTRGILFSKSAYFCGQPKEFGNTGILFGVTETGGQNTLIKTGIQSCGSIASCAVCREKIGRSRARLLDKLVSNNIQKNGESIMLTLTLNHNASDGLNQNKQTLVEAFSHMINSRAFKIFRSCAGMIGYARVIEVTHSTANGFHPHLHCLFLFDDNKKLDTIHDDLKHFFYTLWCRSIAKIAPEKKISKFYGIDVKRNLESGAYLAKWGAGQEMSGSYLKKSGKGRTIAEIENDLFERLPCSESERKLDRIVLEAEKRDIEILKEYYAAMYGTRFIQFSQDSMTELRAIADAQIEKEDADAEEASTLVGLYEMTEQLFNDVNKTPEMLGEFELLLIHNGIEKAVEYLQKKGIYQSGSIKKVNPLSSIFKTFEKSVLFNLQFWIDCDYYH